MRRALVFLLPAFLAAQSPAPAPAPAPTAAEQAEAAAKRADILKLLQAMHSGEMAAQGMRQMVTAMRESNKELPQEFWDEFLKAATPEKLTELVVPIYEEQLTHQEVKAYLAFVQTPDGASIVKKLPEVLKASMKAGQEWGRKLGLEIAQKLHEEGKM